MVHQRSYSILVQTLFVAHLFVESLESLGGGIVSDQSLHQLSWSFSTLSESLDSEHLEFSLDTDLPEERVAFLLSTLRKRHGF